MLFFASALMTALVGLSLLRRAHARALITREPIAWTPVRPARRHVSGAVLFGIGWGTANVCPGPIGAQLGQGVGWSLCTTAGLVIGIAVFLRSAAGARSRRAATR